MEEKIKELTDKLLSEGVEKGKAEAEKIVSSANEQAKGIIADAQKQADDIIAKAKKDSENLMENTKAELRMYARQAEDALKTEIANVVSADAVKNSVSKITADKDFMNHFILKIAEKWGAGENIEIGAADAASLKAVFAAEAKSLLDKKIKIKQVNGQKALFTIEPSDGSYKVCFGEDEFDNYFKSFLRPQIIEMLFK